MLGRVRTGWPLLLVAGLLAPLSSAGGQNLPLPAPRPDGRDSGPLDNSASRERTVHTERVTVPGAAWLRLYLDGSVLPPGSTIRMTSLADGRTQQLDADGLWRWSHSSAYFNGDTVDVELVCGAGTRRNRLRIEKIAWDAQSADESGLCGVCGLDDRAPSSEPWAARLFPSGCSAAVFNYDSCMVSAGHCVTDDMVMQFDVPASLDDCTLSHPPVEDQFPVATVVYANGSVGADWAVMTVGRNSAGQRPFDRYGRFRPAAANAPSAGDSVEIWAYGMDETCSTTRTQQRSAGTLIAVATNFLLHDADTAFGSSGAGILRGGEIVGVVTHCPCPNWGTRIDQPAFRNARNTLCPTPSELYGVLVSVEVLSGELVVGELVDLVEADGGFVEIESSPSELRHATLTEIVVQSPLGSVSRLELRLQGDVFLRDGPSAGASRRPIVLGAQLFDVEAGEYRTVDQVEVVAPDAWSRTIPVTEQPARFVDATGRVRVRLWATARETGLPRGFVKRIDWVYVGLEP